MDDSNLNELTKYKEFRDKITVAHYKQKDYKMSLTICNQFNVQLQEDKATNQYNYWFCYNTKAKAYLQLGMIDKALQYAKMSNWYAKDGSAHRIDTMEVIARCYSDSNVDLSIKCLDKCLTLYRQQGNKRGEAKVLNNKAIRLNSSEIMHKAVEIYDELFQEGIISNTDISRVYENLCNIYIANNHEGKAHSLLHKIIEPKLQQDMSQKLRKMYAQQKVVCI